MTTPLLIDEHLLARAAASGVISAGQAEQLKALALESGQAMEPPDDERLRFASGFNDVFVTIGIGLFLFALRHLTFGITGTATALSYACVAAASWLLAEYFTRKRRMALPSLVLMFAFAGSVLLSVAGFVSGQVSGLTPVMFSGPSALAAASAVTLALTGLHYWRFRVPATVAACVAAACGAIIVLPMAFSWDGAQMIRPHVPLMVLVLGAAVFALAMRFDLKDPRRLTRDTDIAFWLHLLAAPMVVHPLVATIAGPGMTRMDTLPALAVLGAFLALSLIALVVDRRAILVSGLAYAGIAFFRLAGLSGDMGWPLTMLLLGVFVLGLSAGWRPLRRALLACLPARFGARLPHPLTSG